jgi:hypothetical protein
MHLTKRSKNKVSALTGLNLSAEGRPMSTYDKSREDPDANFSYGVSEVRQATAARELRVEHAPHKAASEKRGFDPYNTSGSFDRKKNWVRVGKR